jgi:nicotinamide-nucleotide amidase
MNNTTAEIITIGDEILFGQITDTNSQWMSAELDKMGIKTVRKSAIGDLESEILQIFNEAAGRADIILITGGLGPTKDDITKKTIAKILDDELIINDHALAFITDFFAKRGREMTELNRQQAAIPSKSTYLHNDSGTAPGMWFIYKGSVFVSMPGVPHEMKNLMKNEVMPRLKKHFKSPTITHKVIGTVGIGESFLAEQIEEWEDQLPAHIKLAYLPGRGQVRLRLTGIGDNAEELSKAIDVEIEKVLPQIEKYVYSLTGESLPEAVGRLLMDSNSTISLAESCTGGFASHLFTSIPGSSAYFQGSLVSYANDIKAKTLGVKEETLKAYGAVSEETVKEMAEGVRKLMGTTYGLATSGVAGPTGGTPEKPVGTVFIAVSSAEKTVCRKLQLTLQRKFNIEYSSYSVINLLRLITNKQK